nr:hypothetical protein [Synechococcus sp. CBW1002]
MQPVAGTVHRLMMARRQELDHGWATCPIPENGVVRIMAQPVHPNHRPAAQVAERLNASPFAIDEQLELKEKLTIAGPSAASLSTDSRFSRGSQCTPARKCSGVRLRSQGKRSGTSAST